MILVMETEHLVDLGSDPEISSMLFTAAKEVEPALTTLVLSSGSIWHSLGEHLELHRVDNRANV